MKFGIIGDGHAGKLHKDAIAQIDGEHTIVLADTKFGTNISHLDEFPERLKQCDYISVCVPHGFHVPVTEVIRENCNAKILLEKPVGISKEQLERLVNIKDVYPVFQNRFSPVLNKFKKLFDKIIGEQKAKIFVKINMPRNNDYYLGWRSDPIHCEHVLTNQAIHYFDYLIQLIGGIDKINDKKTLFNDSKSTTLTLYTPQFDIAFEAKTKCTQRDININCYVDDKPKIMLSGDSIFGEYIFEHYEEIHNEYGTYTGSGRYHKEFLEGVIKGDERIPSIKYACDLMNLCFELMK